MRDLDISALSCLLKAGAGIEPANSGFADRDLTTWLPRHCARRETIECSQALSTRGDLTIQRFSESGYREGMTNSRDLFARARRRIPGGVNSPVRGFRAVGGEPVFVGRAKGSRIGNVDDVELIDYVGSWGPAILGHAPPVVVSAIRDAAQRGVSFGIPNPLEVEMAELICAWMPAIEKVRMVNSGTEATMSCLRLARGFTKRDKIVKFAGCYHGHADSLLVKAGSGALTHGQPDSAGIPGAVAGETIVLPFNNIESVRAAFRENKDHIAGDHSGTDSGKRRIIFPAQRFPSSTSRRMHEKRRGLNLR